jgi:transposase
VIRKQFGVRYSTSAIWRLLVVDMNWSTQKPERRATQRDEAAIDQCKRQQWIQVKKKHVGWAPTSLS